MIREQEESLGQTREKEQYLQIIKDIIKTELQIEVSQWNKRGHGITQEDVPRIHRYFKKDPRRKGIIKETIKTQDLAWFKEEITKVIRYAFVQWARDTQNQDYVSPKEFSRLDLLEDLRSKVVRLVFTKKGKPLKGDDGKIVKDENGQVVFDGGEKRVMWATRNPDLITLYTKDYRERGIKPRLDDTNEQSVQNELDKDYFTVLDLEKEEFRTFKPSMLLDFDGDNNVGAWITFDINNDAWFNVAKEGDAISKYYETGKVSGLMAPQNIRRTELEREYLQRAKNSGAVKTPEVVAWERQNMENFLRGESQYVHVLNGTYQDTQVDEAFEALAQFSRTIHQTLEPLLEETDAPDIYVSKQLKRRTKGGTTVNSSLEVTVGDATIVLSPYYIVNTKTGKVYLDRYNLFKFGQSRLSQEEYQRATISDRLISNYIERLIQDASLHTIPKPSKRKRVLSYKDARRLRRLKHIYDLRNEPVVKEFLKELGIQLGYVESRELFKIAVKNKKGRGSIVFLVNSRTIAWQNPVTQQQEVVVSVERHTSALSQMNEGLDRVKRLHRVDPNIVNALTVVGNFLVDNVYNLRVKSMNGIAFE